MILYTMMPDYLVFPTDSSEYVKVEQAVVNGVQMAVRKTENESYQIVQVLSTNPNDYLQYYPGQEI